MSVLYATHARFLDHDTGVGHPERPARLRAVEEGIDAAGLREALVPVAPVAEPPWLWPSELVAAAPVSAGMFPPIRVSMPR